MHLPLTISSITGFIKHSPHPEPIATFTATVTEARHGGLELQEKLQSLTVFQLARLVHLLSLHPDFGYPRILA